MTSQARLQRAEDRTRARGQDACPACGLSADFITVYSSYVDGVSEGPRPVGTPRCRACGRRMVAVSVVNVEREADHGQ